MFDHRPASRGWRVLFAAVALALCSGLLAGCSRSSSTSPDAEHPHEKSFTIKAFITGYRGVGGAIDGARNPTLKVDAGDKVTVTLIGGESMAHDFFVEKAGAKSAPVMDPGQKAVLSFTARQNDKYFCSFPGHRAAGMEGRIEVAGAAPEIAEGPMDHMSMPGMNADLPPVHKITVDEVGADPAKIPPPIHRTRAATVEYTIETREVVAAIDEGTTYDLWTYNGQVPGPFLRARQGDTVVVHLENSSDSKMAHSIDFHAVTGPGGGAVALQVPPGETRTLRFKALRAGLYAYHCATPHVPTHLAHGMFGMFLVEPPQGLPKVDHEYYVMQGEYYTTAKPGIKVHQSEDEDRMFDERPTYVVFNGRVGSLTGSRALTGKVGETVRLFFGVGGPNAASSMHVIGEAFDRLWPLAALEDKPLHDVQTTLVPPGGAMMAEIKLYYPGKYILVDHSLSRMDKGAVGILSVTGKADPSIFQIVGAKP